MSGKGSYLPREKKREQKIKELIICVTSWNTGKTLEDARKIVTKRSVDYVVRRGNVDEVVEGVQKLINMELDAHLEFMAREKRDAKS